MNIPLLDNASGLFSLDLPERETMDQYLDFILPKVRQYSEDVRERPYFEDVRWKEVREGDTFHESVLHILRQEYGVPTYATGSSAGSTNCMTAAAGNVRRLCAKAAHPMRRLFSYARLSMSPKYPRRRPRPAARATLETTRGQPPSA